MVVQTTRSHDTRLYAVEKYLYGIMCKFAKNKKRRLYKPSPIICSAEACEDLLKQYPLKGERLLNGFEKKSLLSIILLSYAKMNV